ncbi:MAG: hypothetical protein M3Z14_01855 [Candidatus Eremiobacteraeota bacterium]|nr:hypothetical protein [Candidatus Eremiobacteraeota bacterium]
MSSRSPVESPDTVSLIIALLVRFPEIASVRSFPADGTVRFSFVTATKLDRAAQSAVAEVIDEHVGGFLHLGEEQPRDVKVECETDKGVTFIHVTRDLASFTKDELLMLVGLLAQRFGDTLVRNPAAEENPDEDPLAQDELVDYAIDSMRDPQQQKNLVGFREEKRVLVYFLKSGKKAKASARS